MRCISQVKSHTFGWDSLICEILSLNSFSVAILSFSWWWKINLGDIEQTWYFFMKLYTILDYVHLLNHHSYYNQEVLTEFGEDTKVAQQWPKSFQCHYLSKHLIITAKGDRKNKRRNTSFSCATNPQFLNLTTSKTKQFCETSSIFELDNIKNEAILQDFL